MTHTMSFAGRQYADPRCRQVVTTNIKILAIYLWKLYMYASIWINLEIIFSPLVLVYDKLSFKLLISENRHQKRGGWRWRGCGEEGGGRKGEGRKRSHGWVQGWFQDFNQGVADILGWWIGRKIIFILNYANIYIK